MTAKEAIFHEDARAKIVRGVTVLANAVKVTLGPKARTALQNAASIAGLILTTDCMVAELREEPPPAHNPGSEMEM